MTTLQKISGLILIALLTTLPSKRVSAEIATAAPIGFNKGNQFAYTPAVGNVVVYCPNTGGARPGGPTSASYQCNGYTFAPSEYALFVGPIVNADEVELTAFHQDGSTRTKSSSYDRTIGRSTDTFNLWIETLFQRPLLNLGRNDVRWTLKRKGTIVANGTFIAEVLQRPTLRCPYASETSMDPNDCRNPGRVCNNYFYDYGNQCR